MQNGAKFVLRDYTYSCMCGMAQIELTSEPAQGTECPVCIIGQSQKNRWDVQTYGSTKGFCVLPKWDKNKRKYNFEDAKGYIFYSKR